MAIKQSQYIGITNKVLNDVIGTRDFSGLVFSKVSMKSDAPKKTEYEVNNNVVRLTKEEVDASFSDTAFKAFCAEYFAYNGGTKRPAFICLAHVGSAETAATAFGRVTADFANFGSFAFYGDDFEVGDAEGGGLLDVAKANEGNEYGWVCIVKTNATNQESDSAALEGLLLTHLTHDVTAPLAWYASVDYDKVASAGTIDYKQFGGHSATVTTDAAKIAADTLKVNYIGLVQDYGNGLKFYQRGVNMDGTDLGVVRDMCWINSEIVREYFALQNNAQRIPANHVGCAMVRNIVVGVADRAITNGAILVDKPLTEAQISQIKFYANDDRAADEVASSGYYIKVELVKDGDKYRVLYTLIYAKGDHIQKVDGQHILV